MEEAIGTALHIETHTEDFVAHSGNNQPYDVKTDYAAALEIKKAFPDIFYKVIRMVEENDYVVAHWKALGTNTGISSYIPVATNKSIEIEGVTIYKLIDGKIAEEWTQSNLITILFNLKLI
jgi:predicted ester cyclase